MAKIELSRGLFAEVDDADLLELSAYSWHAVARRDGKGFYAKNTAGKRMHRLLMGVSDSLVVDHRDGDGLNNRRENHPRSAVHVGLVEKELERLNTA